MAARLQRGVLLQALQRANPWWTDRAWARTDPQLSAAARAPFELRPAILNDITPPNLYTLRGPRRTGKSTVLKQTIVRLAADGVDPRRICYFAADMLGSFNDLISLLQAASALFPDLGDTPRYFLIDEVTSVPSWQQGMKWLRDNTAVARDCIVATGSSAKDIAAGTGFLAGRRGPDVGLDRLLLPLSFAEFVRCVGYDLPAPDPITLDTFYTADGRDACLQALPYLHALVPAFEMYLQVGGFPQAVADFRLQANVSDGFTRDLWDVLQADLRAAGLSRPEQALRLLERLWAYLTGPAVYRTLAGELDVTHSTIAGWLDALANSYLTMMLFQEDDGAPDLRAQRKVYPIDPFLAHVPARLSSGPRSPEPGRLAESVVAAALYRAIEGAAVDRFGRPDKLFWYRTPQGAEVDFIVPPGPRAVESKYVDQVNGRDTRTLTSRFGGGLLLTRSDVDIRAGVTVIPTAIFAWLLEQRG